MNTSTYRSKMRRKLSTLKSNEILSSSCFIRWFACSLAVRFFYNVLNAELKIKSVGLFSVRGISVQFQPQHTLVGLVSASIKHCITPNITALSQPYPINPVKLDMEYMSDFLFFNRRVY